MAKFVMSPADIMSSPHLTISSSPFAPGFSIVKRVTYKGKGRVPPWLSGYLIKKGECAGRTGKVIYGGKPIPKVAECVAEKHKK